MTPSKWLSLARQKRNALSCLIDRYHPVNCRVSDLPISAPVPESACRFLRNEIREESKDRLVAPGIRFDAALLDGNADAAYLLLSETWVGVPESTDCWGVMGFSECVDLLDDPPEYDPPEDAL